MLGAGEPVRVKKGQRVLMRLLNASATENVALALPGHAFTVIAMDGNPVPNPASPWKCFRLQLQNALMPSWR